MEKEIEFATQLIRGDIYHLSQRVENMTRKPRRKCIDRNLACLQSGEIVVINRFDDGTGIIGACIVGVRGPWKAYRVIVKETDWSIPLFALHFEGTGDWIVGRYEKLKGSYLYELFMRAGIQFETKILRSELKRILHEGFVGEICLTENKFKISALAGWSHGKLQCAENYFLGITEDVKNFPVCQKSFKKIELTEDAMTEYFSEMKCIHNEKDRLLVVAYSFLPMIASFLREHKKKLTFGLNFVILFPVDKDRICSWFQIFNRDCCIPLNGGMTNTKLKEELRTIKDESIIVDCTIRDEELPYEKKKKMSTVKKVYSVVLGEERLEGRMNEPVHGGVVTFSSNFLHGRRICNVLVTEEWCQEKIDWKFMENEVMERIYSGLSQYLKCEAEKVSELINKRRSSGDERVNVFAIGMDILNDFWAKHGMDFLNEAGIDKKIKPEEIFDENIYDETELMEQFVHGVRNEAKNYIFISKKSGKSEKNLIYYSEEYLLFPVKLFENILVNQGLCRCKEKILLELKEKGVLKTDAEGLSKKLQINGNRFETYQIRKSLFDEVGKIDIISLGGGVSIMSLICDRNFITLSDIPNEHVMILGSSGYGKTYFCCRHMEEEIARERKILVLDYSSSYGKKEREKNNFDDVKGVREFNPSEHCYYFTLRESDKEKFKKDIADTIVKILRIKGYT